MEKIVPSLLAALLLSGCAARPLPPLALTPADAGSEQQLVAGQTLTVTLPSHYARGYHWMWMNPVNPVLTQLGTPHFRAGETGTAEGGTEVWTFRAEREGRTELHLDLRRPWTTQTPPEQSLRFPLVVD